MMRVIDILIEEVGTFNHEAEKMVYATFSGHLFVISIKCMQQ